MTSLGFLTAILLGMPAWGSYTPNSPDGRNSVSIPAEAAVSLLSRDLTSCPGYTVSSITNTSNTITADLKLAGTACNVNGADVTDLQLLVEYQTGKNTSNYALCSQCQEPPLLI
jgi:hypothetical protein